MFKVFFCDSINLCYSISVKQRNTKKKSLIKQTRLYNYLHHNCRCSSPANVLRGGRKFERRPNKHTRRKESINTSTTEIMGSVSTRDERWPANHLYWHLLVLKSLSVHHLHGHQGRMMKITGIHSTTTHYTTTTTWILHITLVITPTVASILNHYQYSRTIEVIRGDPLVVLENQQTTAV